MIVLDLLFEGFEMKKLLFLNIMIGLLIVGCSKSSEEKLVDETEKLELKVQAYVRTLLKDGDSAKFRNQYKMCGEVNSKNSFGAYTGFTKYIVTDDKTFFEEEYRDELGQAAFSDMWNSVCNSKIIISKENEQIAVDAK